MYELAVAFGLMLIIEGTLYALFPQGMRNFIRQALDMPLSTLRMMGLVCLFGGSAIVWIVKTF